jgi:lysozyme
VNLAGLRIRYLIGTDNATGEDGAFTVVGYDATHPPSKGIGAKYCNLFDEKNSGSYGPYLTSSDTAQQYSEGQCDPNWPGFWQNVTDQLDRAKLQGFTILGDIDNRDAYYNADVLKVYDHAQAAGFSVICKNPGMSDLNEDSTALLKHPAVVGCIIEKGNVTPAMIVVMRTAADKPELPVWFVSFGDGGVWAEQIAAQIKAAHYVNMGVTFSSFSEYGSSEDVLVPLSAVDHPILTSQPVMPTAQNDFAGRVLAAMHAQGATVDVGPDVVNIVYVEGMSPDGIPNANRSNDFDCARIVLRVLLDGSAKILGAWKAVTHAGAYYEVHRLNPIGAFHINLGQQTAWTMGTYHGNPALLQSSPLSGTRDSNNDFKRGGPVYRGDFGVHHHGSGSFSNTTDEIGRGSAGCQVGEDQDAHNNEFIPLLKSDSRYQADHNFMWSSTVLLPEWVMGASAAPIIQAPPLTPVTTIPTLAAPFSGQIQPRVIDLSHYDNVTDNFAGAVQFGIWGVINKASEGFGFKDITFDQRRGVAKTAGLLFGAYHFMRPGDVTQQVTWFLQCVGDTAGLLLALDYEDAGVPESSARQFCQLVHDKVGRWPAIYGGSVIKDNESDFVANVNFWKKIPLWLSHYNARPTWPTAIWDVPWLWQYTGDGLGSGPHGVPGITPSSKLDVDSYNGTRDQLGAEWVAAPSSDPVLVPALPPTVFIPPFSTQPTVPLQSGTAGWFSQYVGKYQWVDTGDTPGSNALGVPDSCQGCAFPTRAALGQWFEIHAPNGSTSIEQQTDVGPAAKTGRSLDISAAAAERLGYSPDNFPTDSTFQWRPVGPPAAVANLTLQQQAIQFHSLRAMTPVVPIPPPTPVPPVVIQLPPPPSSPPPPPAPPIINLPAGHPDQIAVLADQIATVANMLTQVLNSKEFAAGGAARSSAISGWFSSAFGVFFGVWAIPLAGAALGILSALKTHGTVTDPTTVVTTVVGSVALGAFGVRAWLQKAFNVFGQITTAINKGNQP